MLKLPIVEINKIFNKFGQEYGVYCVKWTDMDANLRPKVRQVFNSSESLYTGNFGVADHEYKVKIPKNKMADPVRQKI